MQKHLQAPAGAHTSDLQGLLQLAFNCSAHATAAAALRLLPAHLDQEIAQQLLETAVLRQHADVVQRVVSMQAVRQLGSGAVEQILLLAEHSSSTVEQLLFIPAAAHMRAEVWPG